ncbi:uncharacterized protein LOC132698483 isoform X2 [Cylas formicarius]|uniref:uncharacterized protein LOC132698483 isoform X2 n=1 Tax=Cylas formicarius TaxID=197179 RepID=UPI002958AA08|nr:uncharacterized protein LOC132698483 isoform X2 [Cylas formicarius]
MTQRPKGSNMNLPNLTPELHATKHSKRGKPNLSVPSTATPSQHRHRERYVSGSAKSEYSNNHLIRGNATAKQQNIPSPGSPIDVIQYSASNDSPLVEVTVKHSNMPKQRSKSTVSGREPWAHLLKNQKTGGNQSVFSNFDPLRTLHFLAKELQIHLQALLPNERNVQEIVTAIQGALKRVPPEVASTIHLQQTIELLPNVRKSASLYTLESDIPEKLSKPMIEKSVQTDWYDHEEEELYRTLMRENTIKLEASCRHLEQIGCQLKNDKIYLETQLQNERASLEFFKQRVEDLEDLNRNLLQKVSKRDEELRTLQVEATSLRSELEGVKSTTSLLEGLKQSKTCLEQEITKVKHQLRLCSLEKEKYAAILTIRNRQIGEIRSEMTQLQEVVNDLLVEVNSNATAMAPRDGAVAWNGETNKENMEMDSISSIHGEDGRDMQSGDTQQYRGRKFGSETMVNIRDMFNEYKKQADALMNPTGTKG